MRNNYLLLLLALVLPVLSFALVTDYSCASSSGTYTAISGGTVLAASDDERFANNPIGFTFKYNGTDYTAFSVDTNGAIVMGPTIANYNYTEISGSTNAQVICAMNADLGILTGGELSYLTTGDSPNKVCTIQWKGFKRFSATSSNLNFQIKLYETSNKIEFVYGTCSCTNTTSYPFQVGLKGASSSEYFNRTTTTNWASTIQGTTNTATCAFKSTVVPASGLTLTFTAPVTYANDMQAIALRSPYTLTQNALTANISITIKNKGTAAQSNIPVYFKDVTDNITLNTTVTGPLNAGDTLLVNLGTGYTPTSYGTHSIEVWTDLAGDENSLNNKVTTSRIVLPAPVNSFNEGFEGVTVGSLPAGWITAGTNNTYFSTYDNTTTANNRHPNTGTKFGSFRWSADTYLISQAVNVVTGHTYNFKFYYCTDAISGWTTVAAKCGTEQTAAAMTTTLATVSNPVNTAYTTMTGQFTATTTGIMYMGIYVVATSSPNYMCVDDLTFEEALTNDLAINSVTIPSTDFFAGDDVTITAAIFNNGSAEVTNKDVSFSVDGSSIGTVNIASVASGATSNAVIHWTATAGNHTITAILPDDNNNANNNGSKSFYVSRVGALTEGFNGATFPPADWATTTSITRSTSSPYEGAGMAYFYSSSAIADQRLVTPKLSVVNGDMLTFYAKSNYPAEVLFNVQYSTDKSSWTTIGSTIALTASFAQYSVDLTSLASQNLYIAFNCTSTDTYDGIAIDKVVGPVPYVPSIPEFEITPATATKDFGTVAVGGNAPQIFTLRNAGGGTLQANTVVITGTNANQFTLTNSNSMPYAMTHNQTMAFTVAFTPTSGGTKTATLAVTDDLSRTTHNIVLTGTAIDYNYGGGDENSVSGGYYYANSVSAAPVKPVYNWIDPISESHNLIPVGDAGFVNASSEANIDDANFVIADLGFDFPFYGTSTRKLTVNTNGIIYVGDYAIASAETQPYSAVTSIPDADFAYSAIALLCADLELDAAEAYTPAVYYYTAADKCVITYYKAHSYSTTDVTEYLTAQVILTPDGNIKMQFNYNESALDATPALVNDIVVGIQNAAGTKGIAYHTNTVGGPIFDNSRIGGLAIEYGYSPMTLPVELTAFTAVKVDDHNIAVKWTTESESQISGYRIFRSLNANYANAVCVTPEMIVANNTSETHNYSVVDNNVAVGNTYYYWIQVNEFNNTAVNHGPISIVLNANGQTEAPSVTALNSAYPNPFNPSVTIDYQIKEAGKVNISIYNTKGQLVRTLVNTTKTPAYYKEIWNGTNDNGVKVSTGTYFYRMTTTGYSKTGKLLMLK